MNYEEKLLAEARDLILEMGTVIRKLDTDNDYSEFWTHDGDYVSSRDNLTDRIAHTFSPKIGDTVTVKPPQPGYLVSFRAKVIDMHFNRVSNKLFYLVEDQESDIYEVTDNDLED